MRYFFVTDRISKGEILVEYSSTTEMLADFFTKPLQGHLFRKMHALVMNVPADGTIEWTINTSNITSYINSRI